jgi:hypothetical protein
MNTKPSQTRTCPDCGEHLDAMGICPQAEPKQVARQTSPVHCGKLARAFNLAEILKK